MEENGNRLALAQMLSAYAHAGQVDKAGKPYFLHPQTVAQRVTTEEEKIVALLHDVVEDTFVTLATVENLFGAEIAQAVALMTHDPADSYFEYLEKLAENPLARAVKLADLSHNMELDRIPHVTEKDLKRLQKYQKAKEYLESYKISHHQG